MKNPPVAGFSGGKLELISQTEPYFMRVIFISAFHFDIRASQIAIAKSGLFLPTFQAA
jgi:hypothetical protein